MNEVTPIIATTKIDSMLIRLLSGAQDRDADTPKRREKGAARYDKAYAAITAYVGDLEQRLELAQVLNALNSGVCREKTKTVREQAKTIKQQEKEIARLTKARK